MPIQDLVGYQIAVAVLQFNGLTDAQKIEAAKLAAVACGSQFEPTARDALLKLGRLLAEGRSTP